MSLLFDRYLEKERSKTKRDEKRREKQKLRTSVRLVGWLERGATACRPLTSQLQPPPHLSLSLLGAMKLFYLPLLRIYRSSCLVTHYDSFRFFELLRVFFLPLPIGLISFPREKNARRSGCHRKREIVSVIFFIDIDGTLLDHYVSNRNMQIVPVSAIVAFYFKIYH